jgi:hypothetical protein
MQAIVIGDLREHGPGTAREVVTRTGIPYPFVRDALATLAPPPVGIGEVIVLDGDRFAVAPPRPSAPPRTTTCRIRQSGKHTAPRIDPSGLYVCSACGQPLTDPPVVA